MVAVPGLTPVTTPVDASTEATAEFVLLQEPPVGVVPSVVVPPTHISVLPVKDPSPTVIGFVTLQPFNVIFARKVIVAVPADIPFTSPPFEYDAVTDAVPAALDVKARPAPVLLVNVTVEPIQTLSGPVKGAGNATTVTASVR